MTHPLAAELSRAGVPARVLRRDRSSQAETFCLAVPSSHVGTVLGMGERLAHALGARTARVERDCGMVLVQVPAPFRPMHPVPPGEGMNVPLGRDTRGRPVYVDLSSAATPHFLVCGTTGSGKSETLRTIVSGVARQTDAELILIDGKGETFPNGVTDPREAVARLAWAVGQLSAERDRRLVIVIDELRYVMSPTGLAHLERLTALGRSRRVHVVCATQYASADVLGRIVKANLPGRIVLAVDDAQASTLALGIRGQDAHLLCGRGDALLRDGRGVRRVQVAMVGEFHVEQSFTTSATIQGSAPLVELHPSQVARPVLDEEVRWAMENGRTWPDGVFRPAGVDRIRVRFRPMGQGAAQRIRDAAAEALGYRPHQGYRGYSEDALPPRVAAAMGR